MDELKGLKFLEALDWIEPNWQVWASLLMNRLAGEIGNHDGKGSITITLTLSPTKSARVLDAEMKIVPKFPGPNATAILHAMGDKLTINDPLQGEFPIGQMIKGAEFDQP